MVKRINPGMRYIRNKTLEYDTSPTQEQGGNDFMKKKKKTLRPKMVYKALKKDAIRHFTSVRDPDSFSSASKLRKHYFKKTALRHVEDPLQSVDAYTKHKPYKRRFPQRKT